MFCFGSPAGLPLKGYFFERIFVKVVGDKKLFRKGIKLILWSFILLAVPFKSLSQSISKKKKKSSLT